MGSYFPPKTERNHELYRQWMMLTPEGVRMYPVKDILAEYNQKHPDETIKEARLYEIFKKIENNESLKTKLFVEANPHWEAPEALEYLQLIEQRRDKIRQKKRQTRNAGMKNAQNIHRTVAHSPSAAAVV